MVTQYQRAAALLSIWRDTRIQRAEPVQFSDKRTLEKHTQGERIWCELSNSFEVDRELIDDETEQPAGQKLGVDDTGRQKLDTPGQGEGPE